MHRDPFHLNPRNSIGRAVQGVSGFGDYTYDDAIWQASGGLPRGRQKTCVKTYFVRAIRKYKPRRVVPDGNPHRRSPKGSKQPVSAERGFFDELPVDCDFGVFHSARVCFVRREKIEEEQREHQARYEQKVTPNKKIPAS
jgi:hypothetical protein